MISGVVKLAEDNNIRHIPGKSISIFLQCYYVDLSSTAEPPIESFTDLKPSNTSDLKPSNTSLSRPGDPVVRGHKRSSRNGRVGDAL